MNDEQCMALIDAIKELTSAVREVAENVDGISSYYDFELRKELHLIAEVIEGKAIR